MIKKIIFIFAIIFFISCSAVKKVDYYKYKTNDFESLPITSLKLTLVDIKLATQRDSNKGYASLYICKEYRSDKLIKVVSTCTHVDFKIGIYFRLYICDMELKDALLVASDSILESKYDGLPTYFGLLGIPIE